MRERIVVERFWNKVNRAAKGCWLWTATSNRLGYGQFKYRGRMMRAHIVAFELSNGPVPAGLELDHLCGNRACVNPAHLEPVSHAENCRRAKAKRTTCRNGHPYTAETLIINNKGARCCRICRNKYSRERQWKEHPHHRPLRGAINPNAKLTEAQVVEIRRGTMTGVEAAKHFGVCKNMISLIRTGQAWGHLLGVSSKSQGRRSSF